MIFFVDMKERRKRLALEVGDRLQPSLLLNLRPVIRFIYMKAQVCMSIFFKFVKLLPRHDLIWHGL
jgi:hypothetical protein